MYDIDDTVSTKDINVESMLVLIETGTAGSFSKVMDSPPRGSGAKNLEQLFHLESYKL